MKIQTDFQSTNIAEQVTAPVRKPASTPGQHLPKTENLLQRERSYNNALSVAQMSQNLVQKAINISHRLRSIAAEAMISGNLNRDELTTAISEIRSSITQNSTVDAVVQPATLPQPDVPDAGKELQFLQTAAESMSGGDIPPPEAFDTTIAGLEAKSRTISTTELDILQSLSASTRRASYDISPAQQVDGIHTVIANNPASALSAQGNVDRNFALRLTNYQV